ncbi:PHD finger protein 21A isoform X2 [Aethina tumida]|uniref:PHD finger protein 21A isoform X2 n=1 Tax=Aethina tumida TaxID=116153 RepID=UPI002147FEB6|nr:PHD finger protein 21A isoform X2 [Aethina tumida]
MGLLQNKMKDLEISKELKCNIESNQNQLKNAIFNHQIILQKIKDGSEPTADQQTELIKAEEEIILIGLQQKSLLQLLRDEFKSNQKLQKSSPVKNGNDDKKANLLNRNRKQNISPSATNDDASEDSVDNASIESSTMDREKRPLSPHDMSQTEFLSYFNLCTHDVYREMQSRRVERKRRSTANPHFLYGGRGYEYTSTGKRKRNAYLVSGMSPPQTRQSTKRRSAAEKASPPQPSKQSAPWPPAHKDKETAAASGAAVAAELKNGTENGTTITTVYPSFPAIPNLPSGLIIERVSPGSPSPDSKTCIKCKQPGALTVCEVCANGFHVSCHNRPLTQTPRQCPRCITREVRTVGSLTVPSGMTVSCIHPSDVTEKVRDRDALLSKNESLNAELIKLQDRHTELTISLKSQQSHQQELLMTQQTTEQKIQQIFKFINAVKQPEQKPQENDEAEVVEEPDNKLQLSINSEECDDPEEANKSGNSSCKSVDSPKAQDSPCKSDDSPKSRDSSCKLDDSPKSRSSSCKSDDSPKSFCKSSDSPKSMNSPSKYDESPDQSIKSDSSPTK